jgi:hypothetical protein
MISAESNLAWGMSGFQTTQKLAALSLSATSLPGMDFPVPQMCRKNYQLYRIAQNPYVL